MTLKTTVADKVGDKSQTQSVIEHELFLATEIFQDLNSDGVSKSLPEIARIAAEAEYDGLEISPTHAFRTPVYYLLGQDRIQTLKAQIESHGVKVGGFHWILSFLDHLEPKLQGEIKINSPDAHTQQRTAEYLSNLAMLCAELGGNYMVLGSPAVRNLPDGTNADRANVYTVKTLQKCFGVLEETKVTIYIEPLARAETNYINSLQEAYKLAKLINHYKIRIMADTKAIGGECLDVNPELEQYSATKSLPIANLLENTPEEVFQYIGHYHINDQTKKAAGQGPTDFSDIACVLQDRKYNGTFGFEPFPPYEQDREKMVNDQIAHFKKEWAYANSIDCRFL